MGTSAVHMRVVLPECVVSPPGGSNSLTTRLRMLSILVALLGALLAGAVPMTWPTGVIARHEASIRRQRADQASTGWRPRVFAGAVWLWYTK